MNSKRVTELKEMLDGLGPQIDQLYTNQEIIDRSKELQGAIAKCVFEKISVENPQDRDVCEYVQTLAREHGLTDTETYRRLEDGLRELGYTIGSYIKGMKGEKVARNALKILQYDKGVYILYNIALSDADSQAEYDAIVVTTYGLFVVEVKNWSGNLTIDDKGIIHKEGSESVRYDVPGRMNIKECLLRDCLGEMFPPYYKSILLFSNGCASVEDHYGQVPVYQGGAIIDYIRSERKNGEDLTFHQVMQIIDRIKESHQVQYTASKINSQQIIEDFAWLIAEIEEPSERSVPEDNSSSQAVQMTSPCYDKSKKAEAGRQAKRPGRMTKNRMHEWRRKRSLDLALTTTAAASIGIVFFLTDKASRFIR